jgi:hypothetical protein
MGKPGYSTGKASFFGDSGKHGKVVNVIAHDS